jgi:hypothetical protein
MRNPGGYAIWTGDGPVMERDTITCAHCNTVVFLKRDMSNAGFCVKCMKHLCGACADTGECLPFEKQLELFERGITSKLLRDSVTSRIVGG